MRMDRCYDGDLVIWAEDQARALRRPATTALKDHGEAPLIDMPGLRYAADQVLGDGFPG